MAGYVQTNQTVILPNLPTFSISPIDTGKIMLTPQSVGVAILYSLPPRSPGLHYRFINSSPGVLNGSVFVVAPAGTLFGSVISGPTNGVALTAVAANNSVRFLTGANGSVLSDFIDLTCDGTNWYVDARSQVAGGIAIT